ncbi:family 20 glycosylhydrolase [Lacticaseibacillus zeae]|uniref:Family 20 glycosylhydrolase n=1 Tax=Lacticaseibacillus zeae subsp. silagei TaxID=3068307 RepID=A0ABD7ZAI6_LACZE|nr:MULTISPECIES: family 20 glycosylhydrolase [Lacticaseibacillus]MDE3314357.1 family 20 glycosylhydrolase [Lacticaseibacillus zeae]WLV83989.1 family 20 glycosylhydrolase [Lacticaseibacillus sp. NCIMB 15475]WLV86745.1 family 20 glycosylhydrolase [Lacticaseibacillus sp. NCIMB 15474]
MKKQGIHVWLLALAVLLGIAVGLKQPPKQVAAADNRLQSVFSIDAGRKYFSVDQLETIIDRAHTDGYTDVQILLGNDALRFMLDDMSLTVDGKTYTSDAVKQAVLAGNQAYYNDPNGNALTQADMDAVLKYAAERDINIIPVINSPGHMDAILTAMTKLGINNPAFNGSKRTVDLNNDTAIAFTKALLQKYVSYFKDRVTIFNFGSDEYANDVDTGGWAKLQQTGTYRKFVAYVNDLAQMAENAGLKPMVFNDGIYYNDRTDFGTFDQNLIVSYWTAGWFGYDVAKPEFLANKGLKIMNTNDGWYWVLGRMTGNLYSYETAVASLKSKKFTDVPGASSTVPIIGSVQAVWADNPSAKLDMPALLKLMDQFSTTYTAYMPRPADYSKVDAAIATVPRQLSQYTDASLAKLEAALNAVIRGKKANEQATVDGYAQAITAAVKGLQLRGADYSQVDAAIATAKKLDRQHYQDFAAVDAAIAAVKRGLDITQQSKVDAMATAIQTAIKGLALKPTPPKAPTPTTPEPAPKPTAAAPSKETNKQSPLPSTAEATTPALMLAGASLLASMGLLYWRRRETD